MGAVESVFSKENKASKESKELSSARRSTPLVVDTDTVPSESSSSESPISSHVDLPHLPLTELERLILERKLRRAQRLQNEAYEANKLKLDGVTRELDEERQRFFHPNRETRLRARDQIYAINELMRQREKRRFEDYVLATHMSEDQASALRLEEEKPPSTSIAPSDEQSDADQGGAACEDGSEPGPRTVLGSWALALARVLRELVLTSSSHASGTDSDADLKEAHMTPRRETKFRLGNVNGKRVEMVHKTAKQLEDELRKWDIDTERRQRKLEMDGKHVEASRLNRFRQLRKLSKTELENLASEKEDALESEQRELARLRDKFDRYRKAEEQKAEQQAIAAGEALQQERERSRRRSEEQTAAANERLQTRAQEVSQLKQELVRRQEQIDHLEANSRATLKALEAKANLKAKAAELALQRERLEKQKAEKALSDHNEQSERDREERERRRREKQQKEQERAKLVEQRKKAIEDAGASWTVAKWLESIGVLDEIAPWLVENLRECFHSESQPLSPDDLVMLMRLPVADKVLGEVIAHTFQAETLSFRVKKVIQNGIRELAGWDEAEPVEEQMDTGRMPLGEPPPSPPPTAPSSPRDSTHPTPSASGEPVQPALDMLIPAPDDLKSTHVQSCDDKKTGAQPSSISSSYVAPRRLPAPAPSTSASSSSYVEPRTMKKEQSRQLADTLEGHFQGLDEKFIKDTSAKSSLRKFSYGQVADFWKGLAGLIGPLAAGNAAKLMQLVKKEHCGHTAANSILAVDQSSDDERENMAPQSIADDESKNTEPESIADDESKNKAPESIARFKASNFNITTNSACEWFFVAEPARWLTPGRGECVIVKRSREKLNLLRGKWPLEHEQKLKEMGASPRKAILLQSDPEKARKIKELNERLRDLGCQEINDAELVVLRLYTGPMYIKYSAILRAKADPAEMPRCAELCGGSSSAGIQNQYPATLHTINLGVLKLARLNDTIDKPLYRGLSDGMPPEMFLKPGEDGVRGGVDFWFQSFTTNKDKAVSYANAHSQTAEKHDQSYLCGTLLRMEQGMADRGAQISWLSQYPNEEEVLFPPLTGLQVERRSYRPEGNRKKGNDVTSTGVDCTAEGRVLFLRVRPTVHRLHQQASVQLGCGYSWC